MEDIHKMMSLPNLNSLSPTPNLTPSLGCLSVNVTLIHPSFGPELITPSLFLPFYHVPYLILSWVGTFMVVGECFTSSMIS